MRTKRPKCSSGDTRYMHPYMAKDPTAEWQKSKIVREGRTGIEGVFKKVKVFIEGKIVYECSL